MTRAQETAVQSLHKDLVLAHQLENGVIIVFHIEEYVGEHGCFPHVLVLSRRVVGLDGSIEAPRVRTYTLQPKQETS